MRTLKLSAILLLAGVALAARAEGPGIVVKEASGEAAIVNGDKIKAKEDARKRALREAVAQVAGTMISSDTLASNSQLISDRIYANSAGYVRKYEVLSAKEEANVMTVTVRAEVGTAELDKDLQAVRALINRFGNPRLVIITQEQTIAPDGTTTSSGVMASVLTEGFKKDGWTIIDPHFAAGKLRLTSGVSVGAPEAKEIGTLTKADYILYGNVNYRQQPPPQMFVDATGKSDMFLVTGEYEFTAFATDTGAQLGKIAGKLSGDLKDVTKAKISPTLSYERTAFDMSKAEATNVVAQMRSKAIEYLRDAEQNGGRVVMTVTGLPDFSSVSGFKRFLEAQSGVRNVERGEFSSGKAQFTVQYAGQPADLAERLESAKFNQKKLSVTGVTSNAVELVLGK